jgi:hypothetical protein
MTKDKKLSNLVNIANSNQKADLTASTVKLTVKNEKRDKRICSYITDAEKEKLLSLIGRKSESDAVRDLILEFINKA